MRKTSTAFIWGAILFCTAASLVLFYLNRETVVPGSWGVSAGVRGSWLNIAIKIVFMTMYTFVMAFLGTLIQRRHPQHPIGRLLILAALLFSVTMVFEELTVYLNFTAPENYTNGLWFALIQNLIWVYPFAVILWLVSIFPEGRLPSKNWRWLQGLILLFVIFTSAASLIESPLGSAYQLSNPLLPISKQYPTIYFAVMFLGIAALIGSGFGLVGLMFFRFSRSSGVQRQQLRWLRVSVFATVFFMIIGIGLGFGFNLTGAQLLTNFSLALVPIGIGFAVLRYRLYDLDLLINRTLVYATLTGMLALIYFGGVVIMQAVSQVVLAGSSQIAIVLSTLGIAALFNPLRERIQRTIDRRFYRRKYDAERSLNKFSDAARQEVEIRRMTASLISVVRETVEPEKTILWLKSMETGPNNRKTTNSESSLVS